MAVVVSLRERRAAIRADLTLEAWVSEATEDHGAFPGDAPTMCPLIGRIVNLSSTGLLMLVDAPCRPGREVDVQVPMRPGEPALTLRGYVVRVIERSTCPISGQGGEVLLAIELFDLDEPTRRAVEAVVASNVHDPALN